MDCTILFALILTFPARSDAFNIWNAGFRVRPFASKRWIITTGAGIYRIDSNLKRERNAIAEHNRLLLRQRRQLVEQLAVNPADNAFEILLIVRILYAMDDEAIALREYSSR